MATPYLYKTEIAPKWAGMSLVLRVKPVPEELGNITSAKIWFTLRDAEENLALAKKNAAAGGNVSQVITMDATPPDAYFDVLIAKGDTGGLSGIYDWDIVMEGTDASGRDYREVVAYGTMTILEPESRDWT